MKDKQKEMIIKILTKNGNFTQQIDKYLSGIFPSGSFLYLGNTPKIIQGLGIHNNPIILKQSKLKDLLASGAFGSHLHGLSPKLIKKIPKALEKPQFILKSKNNSIVVITNLADHNDLPIIVSITIDYQGKIGNIKLISNKITSAYGKRDFDKYIIKQIN